MFLGRMRLLVLGLSVVNKGSVQLEFWVLT